MRKKTMAKQLHEKQREKMRPESGHAIQAEQTAFGKQQDGMSPAPPEPPEMSWVGTLSRYAGTGALSMKTVRRRIIEGMADRNLD